MDKLLIILLVMILIRLLVINYNLVSISKSLKDIKEEVSNG